MLKEGYKQTEVGVIPEDWEASTIGDNTNWLSGGTPPRNNEEFWAGTIPWISGSTLKNAEIYTSDQFLTEEGVFVGSKMAPLKSTLLLVRGSALHNEIRAGLVVKPVCFNQDVKALIPDLGLEPKFLTFYILGMTNELLKLVSTAGNSAGVLDTGLVQNFPLLKPELKEQKAIAQALSDTDQLIASLEKLIAKKRDIKTATMQQLLTGKKRLPGYGEDEGMQQTELGGIPEDWEVAPLGDMLKIRHGKNQKEVENINGDFPILATGGVIGKASVPLYSKPSVLIGRKGTIDVPRFMDTPFWTVDTLFYSEIADLADPRFLYYKFLLIDWYQYNEASGVPSLNAAAIERIIQAVPSSKKEQMAISSLLYDFDIELEKLKTKLQKTKAIKQGMMQELLTGKTRLI